MKLQQELLKREFFILFKSAIESINPLTLIKKTCLIRKINSNDYLSIPNSLLFQNKPEPNNAGYSNFKLNKNVYIVAFGKAALGKHLNEFLLYKTLTFITIINRYEFGCGGIDWPKPSG